MVENSRYPPTQLCGFSQFLVVYGSDSSFAFVVRGQREFDTHHRAVLAVHVLNVGESRPVFAFERQGRRLFYSCFPCHGVTLLWLYSVLSLLRYEEGICFSLRIVFLPRPLAPACRRIYSPDLHEVYKAYWDRVGRPLVA